jgi:hypothetical protein
MKSLFCIFFAICVCLYPVGAVYGGEPTYQGKPLSVWVSSLGYKDTLEARRAAQAAIREIGTNAVTYLLDELQALGRLRENNVSNYYQSSDLIAREQNLVFAFDALGASLKPATTVLTRHFEDSELSSRVIGQVMTKSDPDTALILLTKALSNGNYTIRTTAAANLYWLGTNAAIAVPALIACLQDAAPDTNASFHLRAAAAGTLGAIGHRADEVVPALLHALQNDKSVAVRSAAVRALAHFPSNTPAILPALTQVMRNDDAWPVRAAAALSLGAFGTNAVKSLPELYFTSTNDVESRVRSSAGQALKTIEGRKVSSP